MFLILSSFLAEIGNSSNSDDHLVDVIEIISSLTQIIEKVMPPVQYNKLISTQIFIITLLNELYTSIYESIFQRDLF